MAATGDPGDPDAGEATTRAPLSPGTKVEVRTRLDRTRWGKGFRVVRVEEDGYVLERSSDGTTMPVRFPFDDVRHERKRGTWWY